MFYDALLGISFSHLKGDATTTLATYLKDRKADGSAIVVEAVAEGGVQTVKVTVTRDKEIKYNLSLWLDPGRQYMPVRMDTADIDGTGEVASGCKTVVEKAEQADGLWVPLAVTKETGVPVTDHATFVATNFHRGPIDPKELEVDFPAGTRVTNRITQRTYMVEKGGKEREYLRFNSDTGAWEASDGGASGPSTQPATQPAAMPVPH
jgi:hypothetical protein